MQFALFRIDLGAEGKKLLRHEEVPKETNADGVLVSAFDSDDEQCR